MTAWQLSPVELAAGFPLGPSATPALARALPGSPDARGAFELVLRRALTRPPCVVSFSGGRDSSAVLAVAAHVARREGLPPPVALTLRFAGVPATEESAWQERVVTHLGITDWEVAEVADELDLAGAVAADLVARHGVLWPANTLFHAPVAARARGGTLVTGFGGDEVMSPGWAWDRVGRLLARTARPVPGDLVELLGAVSRGPVRRRVLGRRPEPSAPSPWLHPHVDAAVRERWRAARAAEPVRHDRALLRDWWCSRYLQVTRQSLALLAAGHDAAVLHPFTEPGFLAALARERGVAGPRHRTREMVALFGDVLPQETVARVGKATFNGAFWGPRTRAFAHDWDGRGVDPALVDVPVLQREWRSADPDARTHPLLQAAFFSRAR